MDDHSLTKDLEKILEGIVPITYGAVSAIIKVSVEDSFKKAVSNWGLKGRECYEVDYRPRPGFVPYTNGGWTCKGITTIDYLKDTRKVRELPTEKLIRLFEDQVNAKNTVMFSVGCHYYKPDNPKNSFPREHSCYCFGAINLGGPEHIPRKSVLDSVSVSFTFSSMVELNQELEKAFYQIDNFMKGKVVQG